MFSGIGGFEDGIEEVIPYAKCVGFSEINPTAKSIYQRKFGDHKDYGNARKIKPEELPDFDLLVAGFPCQAFSIAGRRQGFNDTRGTLFFEIAPVIREKQPRFLLLENVKGLLSHENGSTLITIITKIDELGYDCEWSIVNSKNHGVPQNRERIIIVGHLRANRRCGSKIFPISEICGQTTRVSKQEITTSTILAHAADGTRGGVVCC